ncbi:MAG: flagellar filament capping protein FliD [Aquificaceae bacterium]|nr:flagellar filament capping protein FliD [Aquificaceae bacterium]
MAGEVYFNNLTGKFDWGSIVDQLIKIKSIPIQRLSQEATRVHQLQSALNKLSQSLSAFSSFLSSLDPEGVLKGKRAISSDETVLTATASDNTPDVNLKITVDQLSRKEVILSRFSTTDINSNISWNGFTLRFAKDYGDYQLYHIDGGTGKLSDLVDRINQVAGESIQASVYFDGSGYRLMLTEKEEGASKLETDPNTNTYVISEASAMNINGVWGLDYTAPLQYAKNAKIRVGDSASVVVSPSNTFENLIVGLNLTVKRVGEATISVTADGSKVSSALSEFVKRYNEVVSEVNRLTAKDAPFQGDYTITGIKSTLSKNLEGLFRYDLVNLKEDGTLELNSRAVNALYSSDRETLKSLLQDIKESIGQYAQNTYTSISRFVSDYEVRLNRINDRISQLSKQIVKEEERLRLEYARVEAFMSRAQEIMARLQAFMVSLSESQKGSKT